MDAESYKILETDMEGKGVSVQPNPMELPEAEAKAVFDQLVKEVVVPKFNELLEALAAIDLTSDLDKPISTAAQAALDLKVNKAWRTGSETEYKVLSDNNYSDLEKTKLAGVANNANNYVHPATHDASMIVESTTKRFAADSEKALWNTVSDKVDKVVGKQLSTEDYTSAEKNKLAGVAESANNYVHPTTHNASMIVESTQRRFSSDTEKALWNTVSDKVDKVKGKQLSTEDYTTVEKNKLAGVAESANNYVHPTTHDASVIVESATKRFAADSEKALWNTVSDKVDKVEGKQLSTEDFTSEEKAKLAGLEVGGETTIELGYFINEAAAKTTPVDTDMIALMDSESGNILKKLSWSNIKTTLENCFGASSVENVVDGNNTGAVRTIGAKSDYSMGQNAFAEGCDTCASGENSHAEGEDTNAVGHISHAEGCYTFAFGEISHAEGCKTCALGEVSHAEGYCTTAETYALHTQGQYNTVNTGSDWSFSTTQNAFVIGNGTGSHAKSNCFRVDYSGNVYGLSAFNSTGADYAEYFEWEDENPDSEDRRGKFVTLNGDRIKIAQEGDFILGVVSSNPAIVGNHPSEVWKDMYLTDVWGDYIMEWRTIPAQTDIDGNVIVEEHQEYLPVINADYDSNQTYISRDKRDEWAAIGMMGQLIVYTDGSCAVNGFCKCNNNGIATTATEGYRVLKVIDEDKILILLK